MNYPANGDTVPGDFDHRSGDCKIHGTNKSHARARGELGPYYCVACLLVVAQIEAARENLKRESK